MGVLMLVGSVCISRMKERKSGITLTIVGMKLFVLFRFGHRLRFVLTGWSSSAVEISFSTLLALLIPSSSTSTLAT